MIISCKLAHKLAFLNQEREKNRMGMGNVRHYVTVSKTACPRFESLYPCQNTDRPHSYAVCFHSYTFFTRFYLKFQLRVHFRADINAIYMYSFVPSDRQSPASMLFAPKGINIKHISKLLGHRDAQVFKIIEFVFF